MSLSSQIDNWATDPSGPVALHLTQTLTSVECIDPEKDRCIIYPPTYADIGYNIDELRDGTLVALVDSVGSQANRMEPVFKSPDSNHGNWLVPQIDIAIGPKPEKEGGFRETRSLLDIAHRSADAVVQSSGELASKLRDAFTKMKETGDASLLAAIAPTSLVFGVWDSRGGSNEKRPRLVRSIIRAWDVEVLHSAAQFNSGWKALNEEQRDALEKEGKKKDKLEPVDAGFKDAPATFRKTKLKHQLDGICHNPEARVLGGVLVNDKIVRDITINLVALRGLKGSTDDETTLLRKYLLALSLYAATTEIELFLREGCHLRYLDADQWYEVPRRGKPTEIALGSKSANEEIKEYANAAVIPFRERWDKELPEGFQYEFNIEKAKELLKKKTGDEDSPE